jgi:RES domain-containing protein
LSAPAALALLKRLAAVKATVWRMVPRLPKTALLFAPCRPEAEADIVLDIMRAIGPLPYVVSGVAGTVRDQVVRFPLALPCPGRFNDGADFGLWYAAFERRTALAESAWHYRRRKRLAGLDPEAAEPESRLLWSVSVDGELVADLVGAARQDERLTADDYGFCQRVGRLAERHLRGGLRYRSARAAGGRILALMRESFIGEPRAEGGFILVLAGRDEVRVVQAAPAGSTHPLESEFRFRPMPA